MFDSITIVATGLFAVLTLVQASLGVYMVRQLRRAPTPPLTDAEARPVLVVLCLRGGDPFLLRTLEHLVDQDYPDYRVRIVVDSAKDSAHEYLRQAFPGGPPPHVEIVTLTKPYNTCTRKMSGILAGTADLPPEAAVVALLDGDTIPHRTWLRELAAPILRGEAAVCTGNRWYSPDPPSLGSMARFWWGAGALPLMTLCRLPWGGTMAVASDLLRDPELRNRLQHAFSEDTTIGDHVSRRGGVIQFEPSLVIINREQIRLRSLFQFDTRQLLAVRLHHFRWPAIALHGLASATIAIYPLMRLAGLPCGFWADIAFVTYFLTTWTFQFREGLAVRAIALRRGEQMGRWTLRRWITSAVAALTLPMLHLLALLRVAWMQTVVWRGVKYRLGGDPPLTLVADLWEQRPPQQRAGVEST